MAALDDAWRGWLRLGTHDRTRFLALLREAYRQEREETLAENRRAAGVASPTVFDEAAVAAMDFEARPW